MSDEAARALASADLGGPLASDLHPSSSSRARLSLEPKEGRSPLDPGLRGIFLRGEITPRHPIRSPRPSSSPCFRSTSSLTYFELHAAARIGSRRRRESRRRPWTPPASSPQPANHCRLRLEVKESTDAFESFSLALCQKLILPWFAGR